MHPNNEKFIKLQKICIKLFENMSGYRGTTIYSKLGYQFCPIIVNRSNPIINVGIMIANERHKLTEIEIEMETENNNYISLVCSSALKQLNELYYNWNYANVLAFIILFKNCELIDQNYFKSDEFIKSISELCFQNDEKAMENKFQIISGGIL